MTVTNEQIRELRNQAREGGDCAMETICDYALGEPVDVKTAPFGPYYTREMAWDECARVIAETFCGNEMLGE